MTAKKKPIEDETPVNGAAVDETATEEHALDEPTEAPSAEIQAAVPETTEPVAAELEATEPVAAEPEAVADVVEPAEGDVAVEPVKAEQAADEPAAETAEPEAGAEVASEPKPEPAASAAAPAGTPVAAEAPPAPPQQSGPKPKKKRLPRALRPTKGRVVREKPQSRKPIVRLEKPEHDRGRSQERQGTVISDAMEKTIVVKVDTIKAHRKYKKVVRRSNTFHAHDERNEAKVGDVVRIVETRPLSKTKRWRLAEIVEAAK
jgi:small subunit ribosomal protein S17